MEYLILVVASLFAVHRLTVLVIEDKITEPIREKIFTRWNPSNTWSYLLTCPWCASIWLGFAVAAAVVFIPQIWLIPALALGFSSLTGLIEERRNR